MPDSGSPADERRWTALVHEECGRLADVQSYGCHAWRTHSAIEIEVVPAVWRERAEEATGEARRIRRDKQAAEARLAELESAARAVVKAADAQILPLGMRTHSVTDGLRAALSRPGEEGQ